MPLEVSTATDLAEDNENAFDAFYEVTAHGFYPIAFHDIKPETRFVAIPRALQGEIQAMVSHLKKSQGSSMTSRWKSKITSLDIETDAIIPSVAMGLSAAAAIGFYFLFGAVAGDFTHWSVFLFASPIWAIAMGVFSVGTLFLSKNILEKKFKKLLAPLSDRLEKERIEVMTLNSFKATNGKPFTMRNPSAEQLIRAKELLQERIDGPQAKIEEINEAIKNIVEGDFNENEDAQLLALRKQKQSELEKAHELDVEIASLLANDQLMTSEDVTNT